MSDPNAGPADLFRQLITVFAAQLERFQNEEPVGDVEKRARALSVLAKTLESITAIGIKLNAVGAANFDPNANGNPGMEPQSKANDVAELDRHLAQLVSNLVQTGETG